MKPKQIELNMQVPFTPPKLIAVIDYGYLLDPPLPVHECEKFHAYFESKGWMVGRTKMKDWRAALRHWQLNIKTKPKTIYELTKIMEAKQRLADEIKRKSLLDVAGGKKWVAEQARLEYVQLLKEIKQITVMISQM